MNLYAKADGKYTLDLWQTPTRITYTLCVDENGPAERLTGKNARRALQAYYQWVKYSTNGSWSSKEELETAIENVREHLEYIRPYLNSKKIEVWVM